MKLLITTLTIIFISFGANANWKLTEHKDEMDGSEIFEIETDLALPTRQMNFPYQRTKSILVVSCMKNGILLPSIRFTNSPNLNNTEINDGSNKIMTRIKFDDKIESMRFDQKWGSKYINMYSASQFIKSLKGTDEILLELDWHGNGIVYFKYNTKGASESIKRLKTKCKIK